MENREDLESRKMLDQMATDGGEDKQIGPPGVRQTRASSDSPLIMQPEDVYGPLSAMRFAYPKNSRGKTLADLQRMADTLRELVISGTEINWREQFSYIGSTAYAILCATNWNMGTGWTIDDFISKLITKARNYGPRPIYRWGELGVLIRIDAKIDRLANLEKLSTSGQTVEHGDETRLDTMEDIFGYAVLGYRLTYIPALTRRC